MPTFETHVSNIHNASEIQRLIADELHRISGFRQTTPDGIRNTLYRLNHDYPSEFTREQVRLIAEIYDCCGQVLNDRQRRQLATRSFAVVQTLHSIKPRQRLESAAS